MGGGFVPFPWERSFPYAARSQYNAAGRVYVEVLELNFNSVLFGPVYRTIGVPVTLTIGVVTYPQIGQPELRAREMTEGVDLGAIVTVETTRPMASVRNADIIALGLVREQLDGAILSMNGIEREITSHKPMPSPSGEEDGEIYLFLTETAP